MGSPMRSADLGQLAMIPPAHKAVSVPATALPAGGAVATWGPMLRHAPPILRRLAQCAWSRPAAKWAALSVLISLLAWFGSRASPAGLRPPTIAQLASAAATGLPNTRADSVPEREESGSTLPDAASSQADAPLATARTGLLADGRIVLNVASEEELQKLPKIGAVRARAIVALRHKVGRFRSVRDLLRVKGIGPRTLGRLQPLIVIDPPADAGS
jgi:competence protein ComEA